MIDLEGQAAGHRERAHATHQGRAELPEPRLQEPGEGTQQGQGGEHRTRQQVECSHFNVPHMFLIIY